ncbi:MAG: MFS transporter [Chloroflexota bacterium]
MARRPGGLWRHRDFLKLWIGQTISMFGSMAGRFALSLVAVIVLRASPGDIAILNACTFVPELLVGLFAGVLVDRMRRRPLLVAADLGRAVTIAWIPLAAFLHILTMRQLFAAGAMVSALAVVFDIAYVSYVPTLVGRGNLVEGNSKLEASAAVAEAGGFGLGGVLVQALTAPVAVAIDAVSFVVSAVSIALIGSNEEHAAPVGERSAQSVLQEQRRVWWEIREGLRSVAQDPIRRPIAGATWTAGVFDTMVGVVIMLFFVHDLHLQPAVMGPLFGIGGVASFFGAVMAPRVVWRWGLGRTLIGALLIGEIGLVCVACAAGTPLLVLGLLATQQIIGDSSATVYNINRVTLLQRCSPDRLLGRVNATVRFIETTAMMGGLLLGGILGQTLGLRPTLFVAAAGGFLAPLWYVFSPVRTLDSFPTESQPELVSV